MYCAGRADPPAYPDTALLTPFTCRKTASTPQKQPPANTAVCGPLTVDAGMSVAGAGRAADPLAAPKARTAASRPSNAAAAMRYRDLIIVQLLFEPARSPPRAPSGQEIAATASASLVAPGVQSLQSYRPGDRGQTARTRALPARGFLV